MSKEKLKKYYAHEDGKSQLRSVKAKNDEEALLKFRELFGHDKMGEDFAKFADTMHSVGAL